MLELYYHSFTFTLGERDYIQITTALSFTNAVLTGCIEFLIVNDSNPIEFTEQFTITASSTTATITILNNSKHTWLPKILKMGDPYISTHLGN